MNSSVFRSFLVLAALLPLATLSACGGNTTVTGGTGGSGGSGASGGAGGTGGGPSAAEACAALEKAACQKSDACTNNLATLLRYGDEATCETRAALGCEAALAAAGTSQTPTSFAGCGDAISSETCTDYLDNHSPDACVPKPGALDAGKACAFNAQCQSTFCKTDPNTACGVCAPAPKAGDACLDTAQCGRELLCVKAAGATAGTCQAPVASGGMCDKGTSACGTGLSCVGPMAGGPGTCQPEGTKVGDACDSKKKDAPGCDSALGLYCPIGAGAKCAAVKEAKAGEACGIVGTDVVVCTAGAACIRPMGMTQGTCVAPAADGAACDTAAGPPCLSPARCVLTDPKGTAGKCQLPDASICK